MPTETFNLREFGQAAPKAAASAKPGQEGQTKGAPPKAPPVAPLDDGFMPLMLGTKQEDPRVVAQRQADQTLTEARAQAEDIRRKAYDQGFAQGQEDGLAAGRAKIEAASDNLGRALAALDQATDGVLATLEPEIVALVLAASEALWGMEGAVSPEAVRRVAAAAIAAAGEVAELKVAVSPADYKQVESFRPQLLERFNHLKRLEVAVDESLSAGGCLVTSVHTRVDATLETRRDRIFTALTQRLKQGPPLDLKALAPRPDAIPEAPAAIAPEPPAPRETAPAAEPPAEQDWGAGADPLPELEETW